MALSFEFDFEKAKAALVYLAGKQVPEFDKYKALKLLFLADREHLIRFGRPITGDSYDALPYGPVPVHMLSILGGMEAVLTEEDVPFGVAASARTLAESFRMESGKYPTYRAVEPPDLEQLSESDIVVLDEVAEEFGRKCFDEIYDLTHSMKAYTAVWIEGAARKKFPMRFEDFSSTCRNERPCWKR